MDPYSNYLNYVESPFQNKAFQKKTPSKLAKNNNYNKKILTSSAINFHKIHSKVTKYRGELDIYSPGNKNILIESDSELTTNSKNLNGNSGCTKLVIEKIESQIPQINNEYYKFTNKRIFENKKINETPKFYKKNYVKKKKPRYASNIRDNQKEQNYYEKFIQKGRLINNNNSRKSANNIFNSSYDYAQLSNKKHKNKNNSVIIGDSKYIKGYNENIYNNEYNEPSYDEEKMNSMKYYELINNNNNKYLRKNKDKDLNLSSRRSSLYEDYKDLIKLNTFSRISKYNNNRNFIINRQYGKIDLYPGYNNKLIKIQSAWRGTYVRILMEFYWNLVSFKNVLENIFKKHLYKYFFELLKNSVHFSKKDLDEYKIALTQKEEDYDNLLKNYNALVQRCTELQDIISRNKYDENKNGWNNNKNNSSNKKKKSINNNDNIEIDTIKKSLWNKLIIVNKINNIEIVSNNDKVEENKDNNKINEIKKFDIILMEQKDKFNIIKINEIQEQRNQEPENYYNNGLKLRAKYKKKKQDLYQNYIDHFTSNLCVINTEKLIIEETYKARDKVKFKISKFRITLNKNDKKIESKKENKIIKSTQFELINNNDRILDDIKKKIFKDEFIQIDNNNELFVERLKKNKNENMQKVNNNELFIGGIKHDKFKNKNKFIKKDNNNEIFIKGIKNEKEFKNEFIQKDKNEELYIKGIKNENAIENSTNNIIKDLKEESQQNLNIQIIRQKNETNNNIECKINSVTIKSKPEIKINNLIIQKISDIQLSWNTYIQSLQIIYSENNNLIIKRQKKKKKKEKMTEITEELNPIFPCNIIEFNIEKIIQKIKYINNKEQEFYFLKDINNNDIKYNNVILEINKGEALEINPILLKKTEVKKENDFDILSNKYVLYTLKAKNNMMKMILPIKIKIILKKSAFHFIINCLEDNKKSKEID